MMIFAVLLVVFLSFSAVPVFAESQQDPFLGVSQSDVQASSMVADHPPRISVLEKITDNLDGTWTYSYQICFNVETVNIWWVGIETRFSYSSTTVGSFTRFAGHSSWTLTMNLPINSVLPLADARNIDPSITGFQGTTDPYYPGPPLLDPIVFGERAYGFSFRANAYDPNPKVFWYEVEGHYLEDDKISAWGWTDNVCHYGPAPVGGELVVSSEPQSLLSKYGLLFSGVLIVPAAGIFYLEKKKRRK